jgi:hypothetical protein
MAGVWFYLWKQAFWMNLKIISELSLDFNIANISCGKLVDK